MIVPLGWRRTLADRSLRRRPHRATLVAIARDEAPYLVEWLAFHLAVGFDRIVVYDNESRDGGGALLDRIGARDLRVRRVPWPSPEADSPQVGAYRHALPGLVTPWVMFLDIDEFLVPFGHPNLPALLAGLPDDVSSLHVNWRGFGASGVAGPGYGLVTRAFTRCAPTDWTNHLHFKTLARTARITEVRVHDVVTAGGRRVLSDGHDFANTSLGSSDRVVYAGVQVNHYQCKTYPEFRARMERGDANHPPGHVHRPRDASAERFALFDRNEEEDGAIRAFDAAFARELRRLASLFGRAPHFPGEVARPCG